MAKVPALTPFYQAVQSLFGRFRVSAKSVFKGSFKVEYRGVKAQRCPFDYVIYQMILSELRPDLVIEVGTNFGGGALYLADLMEIMGHGMLHAIDIRNAATSELVQGHPRIKMFTEGWDKYDTREAEGNKKVLVIEDSSHTYENTIGVMRKFAPLVTPGSYLIVEDGIVTAIGMQKKYDGGPLRAIKDFLNETTDFHIDRKRCDMFGKNATFNIDGYLKKRE